MQAGDGRSKSTRIQLWNLTSRLSGSVEIGNRFRVRIADARTFHILASKHRDSLKFDQHRGLLFPRL